MVWEGVGGGCWATFPPRIVPASEHISDAEIPKAAFLNIKEMGELRSEYIQRAVRLFGQTRDGYITALDVLLDDGRLTKWQVFKCCLANDSFTATFWVLRAPARTIYTATTGLCSLRTRQTYTRATTMYPIRVNSVTLPYPRLLSYRRMLIDQRTPRASASKITKVASAGVPYICMSSVK